MCVCVCVLRTDISLLLTSFVANCVVSLCVVRSASISFGIAVYVTKISVEVADPKIDL